MRTLKVHANRRRGVPRRCCQRVAGTLARLAENGRACRVRSQELADAVTVPPCAHACPTSPGRPRSARPRCRGCSTTGPAWPPRPGRPSSPPSTCSATSARPGCASAAPAWSAWSCRSWTTRSSRRSRRSSSRPWRRAATPRCCAPRRRAASPRTSTWRCCWTARSSGIVFVSGLHADTAADHDRYRTLLARPLPIVLINGYVAGHRRALRLLRRRGEAAELAVAPPGRARPPPDRPDHRPGPVRAGAAQARRLPAGDAPAAGTHDADLDELVELSLFGVEGGEAAAARLLERGRHRHRLRLGPDGARRDPRRPPARAVACPRTSPWSATTTRR